MASLFAIGCALPTCLPEDVPVWLWQLCVACLWLLRQVSRGRELFSLSRQDGARAGARAQAGAPAGATAAIRADGRRSSAKERVRVEYLRSAGAYPERGYAPRRSRQCLRHLGCRSNASGIRQPAEATSSRKVPLPSISTEAKNGAKLTRWPLRHIQTFSRLFKRLAWFSRGAKWTGLCPP